MFDGDGRYSANDFQAARRETDDRAPLLTDDLVEIAIAKADYYARRISRSLDLPRIDIDDLRQDLLVEVVRRAHAYASERAAWSTFVELVVRHAAGDIASRLIQERTIVRGSIDEPVAGADGAPVSRGELFSSDAGMGAFWAGPPDPFVTVENRIDLERFVQSLPESLRRLCDLLQAETPTVAQRLSGLSPAEFYREIADLRMRLRTIGLRQGTP